MKHIKLLAVLAAVLLIALLLPAPAVQADGGVGSVPCPGSLATRLEVNMTGYVAQRYSSLRDTPGGSVTRVMYTGAEFTVIDGPQCGGGLTHFKLDYGNGVVGWAAESQVYSLYGWNQYWLAPGEAPGGEEPPAGTCAGSLPTRLAVNDTGVVARSYSTLRNAPGGDPVRIMANGMTFTVLEGPVCGGTGDLAWYRVRYSGGTEGWSSESQRYSIFGNNLYWLAPTS
ncbi:MAG: SH3 domain-containing protein [Anaerolineae bacterium]|nr:SH3 domain-containing protein [Anaerolineae bacterium]